MDGDQEVSVRFVGRICSIIKLKKLIRGPGEQHLYATIITFQLLFNFV